MITIVLLPKDNSIYIFNLNVSYISKNFRFHKYMPGNEKNQFFQYSKLHSKKLLFLYNFNSYLNKIYFSYAIIEIE